MLTPNPDSKLTPMKVQQKVAAAEARESSALSAAKHAEQKVGLCPRICLGYGYGYSDTITFTVIVMVAFTVTITVTIMIMVPVTVSLARVSIWSIVVIPTS